MITKNQKVTVKWGTKNKKHYIDKGYRFTKYRDSFIAKAEDIPRTSKVIINVTCDLCRHSTYKITVHAANKSTEHICDFCINNRNKICTTCKTCNKVFESTKTALNKSKSGFSFCSNLCVGKFNQEIRDKKIQKECTICREPYWIPQNRIKISVTCSISCQNRWQSKFLIGENASNFKGGNREKPCLNCDEVFACNSPYQYKHRKFCGLECKHQYWEDNTLNTKTFKENRMKGILAYREKLSNNNIETKPEKITREYFESIGLIKNKDFYQEQGMLGRYFTDFFFPKTKLVVEVMGDYWHGNPEKYGEGKIPLYADQIKQIKKDGIRKQAFIDSGFTYIEIWEKDIYEDINRTIERNCLKYIPVTTTRRTSKP